MLLIVWISLWVKKLLLLMLLLHWRSVILKLRVLLLLWSSVTVKVWLIRNIWVSCSIEHVLNSLDVVMPVQLKVFKIVVAEEIQILTSIIVFKLSSFPKRISKESSTTTCKHQVLSKVCLGSPLISSDFPTEMKTNRKTKEHCTDSKFIKQ